MSKEGILKRGKENYEANRFLDNSETLAYVCVEAGGEWNYEKRVCIPKEEEKPKEAKKDAKPAK